MRARPFTTAAARERAPSRPSSGRACSSPSAVAASRSSKPLRAEMPPGAGSCRLTPDHLPACGGGLLEVLTRSCPGCASSSSSALPLKSLAPPLSEESVPSSLRPVTSDRGVVPSSPGASMSVVRLMFVESRRKHADDGERALVAAPLPSRPPPPPPPQPLPAHRPLPTPSSPVPNCDGPIAEARGVSSDHRPDASTSGPAEPRPAPGGNVRFQECTIPLCECEGTRRCHSTVPRGVSKGYKGASRSYRETRGGMGDMGRYGEISSAC